MPPAICLMGPTASGKTALTLRLAEVFPCEVVSVDSVQVYRGMDIGSAKPDAQLRVKIPHHLIDIRDIDTPYSVAEFYQDAAHIMQGIIQRGRIPLLTGGTFLYFRALERGLDPLPRADATIRNRIIAAADAEGWQAMHDRLTSVDPEAAQRIDRHDAQRIQRALEVFELTGQPMSHFFSVASKNTLPYRFIKLALVPRSRTWLYQRINQRFDDMMASGLMAEVKALFYKDDGCLDCSASRAVGYRQLLEYLRGHGERDEAIEKGKTASRRYAKRQLTWLRQEENVVRYEAESSTVQEEIVQYLEKILDVC